MANHTTADQRKELVELVNDIEIAMMTTQRADGMLVTRPMATQECEFDGDLWFVTNIDTQKVEEIRANPKVNIAYYSDSSKEWVSVSGEAMLSQDRAKIRELHAPDWKMWFEDEGGERDGGPDDPRLCLIFVKPLTAHCMKAKYSKPRVLFEIAKGMATGKKPDIGKEIELSKDELGQTSRAK